MIGKTLNGAKIARWLREEHGATDCPFSVIYGAEYTLSDGTKVRVADASVAQGYGRKHMMTLELAA